MNHAPIESTCIDVKRSFNRYKVFSDQAVTIFHLYLYFHKNKYIYSRPDWPGLILPIYNHVFYLKSYTFICIYQWLF